MTRKIKLIGFISFVSLLCILFVATGSKIRRGILTACSTSDIFTVERCPPRKRSGEFSALSDVIPVSGSSDIRQANHRSVGSSKIYRHFIGPFFVCWSLRKQFESWEPSNRIYYK
jgi:hypothetical protein